VSSWISASEFAAPDRGANGSWKHRAPVVWAVTSAEAMFVGGGAAPTSPSASMNAEADGEGFSASSLLACLRAIFFTFARLGALLEASGPAARAVPRERGHQDQDGNDQRR
jgi:hypothetical protein